MILSIAWAAAMSAAPPASKAMAETRTVAVELREGERLLGTPRLQVRIGQTAEIATAGPDGYRLNLLVQAMGENYLVRSSLYRPAGESWELLGAPAILVSPGQPARAAVGRGANAGYSLSVTVE
jgi:hypothetical protein